MLADRLTGKEHAMSNPNRVGLAFAVLLGGAHLMWAALVALGLGQVLFDFALWAHMIHLGITIGPFDPAAAVALVLITAILGYIVGYIGSLVWNRIR
jgi:hypothetical protein